MKPNHDHAAADRAPAPVTNRVRRLSVATLLAAAAPLAVAVAALAAAPLAASVPVAAPSIASHLGAAFSGDSGDPCQGPHLGAFNTLKLPSCAGD